MVLPFGVGGFALVGAGVQDVDHWTSGVACYRRVTPHRLGVSADQDASTLYNTRPAYC